MGNLQHPHEKACHCQILMCPPWVVEQPVAMCLRVSKPNDALEQIHKTALLVALGIGSEGIEMYDGRVIVTAENFVHSPSLSVPQAVKLLRQQLDRAGEIEQCRYDDPAVHKWRNTTEQILHAVWGKPGGQAHQNTSEFLHCFKPPFSLYRATPPAQLQAGHIERTSKQKDYASYCTSCVAVDATSLA
jgi:hypothetical protein